ncbi:hypothetical protein Kisp01_50390 [Kineosporia sp. NBRC 101677]|uniref:ImmA/IrrE family metallo-endopeptidase n=1 Tax=Kineosporia sp. NBRC 101677 TaxID=3032197 RepID=UPI00249FDB49|nr:hypothetical protein [Kineosporia sp. NBRC 101677]GLY18025.1 hypothetical protein Kisp01_50390 [Kineosporia sp. NBRC 101677]
MEFPKWDSEAGRLELYVRRRQVERSWSLERFLEWYGIGEPFNYWISMAIDMVPPEFQGLAKEIVIVASRAGDLNARAYRLSRNVRVIELDLRLIATYAAFGFAIQGFMDDFSSWRTEQRKSFTKRYFQHDQLLDVLAQEARDFRLATKASAPLLKASKLLDEHFNNPSREHLSSIRPLAEEAGPYWIAAIQFVIAHEVAHHLLDHTARPGDPLVIRGREFLYDWLDGFKFGYELPEVANSRQRRELEADSLAVRFLMPKHSPTVLKEWPPLMDHQAAAGAFVALPALSLRESISDSSRPESISPVNNGIYALASHPTFDMRCRNVVSLLAAAGEETRTEEVEGVGLVLRSYDAAAFAARLWAFREYIIGASYDAKGKSTEASRFRIEFMEPGKK